MWDTGDNRRKIRGIVIGVNKLFAIMKEVNNPSGYGCVPALIWEVKFNLGSLSIRLTCGALSNALTKVRKMTSV